MNVSGYKVVSCYDPARLGEFVGTPLEQGWVLHGSPFTHGAQAYLVLW